LKKEAFLYLKEEGRVSCRLCPHLCKIKPERYGFCGVRKNEGGKLFALNYGEVSSITIDPIEKKPLFHFFPGSITLSMGSVGCNLRCRHCQNWEIAHADMEKNRGLEFFSPEEIISLNKKHQSAGISFTYNEPTIWLEYAFDLSKLAKKEGFYTVFVTNGYITPEGLDTIAPFLSAYRVDLKGFRLASYGEIARIKDFTPILEAARRALHQWKLHVEIVTNVIPTINDSQEELREIASFIRNELGEKTPWHVTRFYPYLEFSHLPPTPISTLEKAREIGMEEGLKFVYLGNVPGHPYENTYCPNCGKEVVSRSGFSILSYKVKQGKCSFCGEGLNIVE